MFRVAFVCEGPADRAILEAVLDSYLDDYDSTEVQPPTSRFGGDAGQFGGGWKGVKRWCESEVRAMGGLNKVAILRNHDLLVIQVDADVAAEDEVNRSRPCPPPCHTMGEVRDLILEWLGIDAVPKKVVLCVPSMASETWALVALFPDNEVVVPCESLKKEGLCIECRTDIKQLLRKLGKKLRPKLVVSKAGALKNNAKGYECQQARITNGWSNVILSCKEAYCFHSSLLESISQ